MTDLDLIEWKMTRWRHEDGEPFEEYQRRKREADRDYHREQFVKAIPQLIFITLAALIGGPIVVCAVLGVL